MKKEIKKKRKKSSIDKRLDNAWSIQVRAIGKCEKCGATDKQLHAHHIIGRVVRIIRWDLRNGICLCPHCHTFGKESAHTDIENFRSFILLYRKDDWDYLQDKKKEEYKMNQNDKRELLKLLKEGK